MERLSVVYASALFDLAMQQNVIDDFLEEAIFLHDYMNEGEFHYMLVHPQITASEKKDIFRKAFEGKIHEDLLCFLYLATDKNRESYVIGALKSLIDMIKRHSKIVTAKILSAAPYDEKQIASLKDTITRKINKEIELDLKVDPSVIGGPYIFVDGFFMDWTVKKKLHDLHLSLKG